MKKFLCAALALLLGLSVTAPAFADEAADCSDWAKLYVSDAKTMKLLPESLKGCDFTQDISREEFCELAYETMGYMWAVFDANADKGGDGTHEFVRRYPIASPGYKPFTDTDSKAVTALNEAGIILGVGSDEFSPDASITRQEAATITRRIALYYGLQIFIYWSGLVDFTDFDQIDDWASEGVKTVCAMGLMVGMSKSVFSPMTTYTREQAVATMIRLIDSIPYLGNQEVVTDDLFCTFNSMWMWVANSEGEVLYRLPMHWATYDYRPDYGYSGWTFFDFDGRKVVAVWGQASADVAEAHTAILDAATGQEILALPKEAALFYGLSTDKTKLIMYNSVMGTEPGDWGTEYYGVYDRDGKELMSTTHKWTDLFNAGYVDKASSTDYTWR